MCICQVVEITYSNKTEQYQILRVEDLRCYIERTVAPHNEISFKACLDATAKIYTTDGFVTAILSEKTKIYSLQNKEELTLHFREPNHEY